MVFYVKNEEKNLKKRQDNFKNLLNVFQRYSVTPSSPSSFFVEEWPELRAASYETHRHPSLLLTSSDSVHSPRTDQRN